MQPKTIIVIVLLCLWTVYTIMRYKKLSKDVNTLSKLLYIEKNPEAYKAKCREFVKKSNPKKKDYDINLLQLSTGEMFAGDFDAALKTLTDDLNKIPMNGQHLFYQNLIFSYYFNGQIDKGHEEFEKSKEILAPYKKTPANFDAIEFISVVDEVFYHKGIDEAAWKEKLRERVEFLEGRSENGRNPYRMALASYMLVKVYEILGEKEKMQYHMEICLKEGQNSFMEKFVKEMMTEEELAKAYENIEADKNKKDESTNEIEEVEEKEEIEKLREHEEVEEIEK